MFKPHMQSQSPFEDLCRELWCSNSTHALRAHPALEGTDCKSTPYPFGSTCKSGECTPFNLNESEIEVETEAPAAQSPVLNSETTKASNIQRNEIYDSPGRLVRPLLQPDLPGYQRQIQGEDPVLFMSHKGNMYNSQGVHKSEDVSAVKFRNGRLQSATWHLQLNACPVPCGGGWTSVEHQCKQLGGACEGGALQS